MSSVFRNRLSVVNRYNSHIRVAVAGAEPASGSGSFLRIRFAETIPEGAAPRFLVRKAQLNSGEIAVATPTSAWSADGLPPALTLHSAMPNPFNPSTQIRFDLPQDGVAEIVVFNILGQSIRLLRSTIMRAGSHDIRWDGLDNNGLAVGVGVYVVRLTTTTGARAIRVALVR